jgi:uncharacterized membrane protein YhaH (DUF805 family)
VEAVMNKAYEMPIKDILFSNKGRICRRSYWVANSWVVGFWIAVILAVKNMIPSKFSMDEVVLLSVACIVIIIVIYTETVDF